jgi:hypothetical protein
VVVSNDLVLSLFKRIEDLETRLRHVEAARFKLLLPPVGAASAS